MRLWMRVIGVVLLAGCGGGEVTHQPCDSDESCSAGFFCQAGVGCDFECRVDIDCLGRGGGPCDVARGRCGGAMDGGVRPDGSPPCTDDECDDGAYCNGAEACVEGACRAGEPPCSAAECDEASNTCDACLDPDRDDDGYDRVGCGDGRDCNDDDARIPRQEVCDAAGVDEDCDPATVGSGVLDDGDDDGYLPDTCCNPSEEGPICGTDCDDTRANVWIGAPEECDLVDTNCDGELDEDCECIDDTERPCGPTTEIGECSFGTQACRDGAWETGCAGDVTPMAEVCNGRDDDCNGVPDNGPATTSCTARAGATPTCSSGVCGFACNSGYADCDGAEGNGCERHLDSDAANCGSCGNVCPVGGACVSGVCRCSGASQNCGGTCRDVASDINNCGSCENGCPAGAGCISGTCRCPSGTVLCGGTCQNATASCSAGCAGTGTLSACPAGTLTCSIPYRDWSCAYGSISGGECINSLEPRGYYIGGDWADDRDEMMLEATYFPPMIDTTAKRFSFDIYRRANGSGNGSCCGDNSSIVVAEVVCDDVVRWSVRESDFASDGSRTRIVVPLSGGTGWCRMQFRNNGNTCCCGCGREFDTFLMESVGPRRC